jgi:hypothetical protein
MLNTLSILLTHSVVMRATVPPFEKELCGLLRLLEWGIYGK